MENRKSTSIEIIRYHIPSTDHIDFEEAYKKAGKFLESSPYCTAYNIIKGSDEPDSYIITIYWTSVEDHLQKFRSSNHFSVFFQLVKPFFAAIQEMKHYHLPLIEWKRSNNE